MFNWCGVRQVRFKKQVSNSISHLSDVHEKVEHFPKVHHEAMRWSDGGQFLSDNTINNRAYPRG